LLNGGLMKTAFLFPGQGAQKTGMGKSFYDVDADARAVFDEASKLLGIDMAALCFEPDERLNLTEYTQAAMVTTGIAMLKVLEKNHIKADVSAGLSLGEYESLYYAGVLSAKDAIRTVRKRGILMQEAVPVGVGAMAAVLRLDIPVIEETIKDIEGVWIANYNCPGQIVISGTKEGVEKASEKLKEEGAKRVLPLKVSGPFHSPLLSEAGEKLYEFLEDVKFSQVEHPYVANYTAEYVEDSENIRELLKKQVSGSVKFEQSIRTMLADGVDTFIEVGPGKTLSGFVKTIDPSVRIRNIETMEDLQALVAEGL
jgi:[acyl-carrier-protein] S-malonyltransferase